MNTQNSTMSAPTGAIASNALLLPVAPAINEMAPKSEMPAISEKLMQEKAILVHLTLTKIGRTRQVNGHELQLARSNASNQLEETDADREWYRVTKTLFKCAELKSIEQLDAGIRNYISRKCLPSPLRGRSVYLVPLGNVEALNTRMENFAVERANLIAEFVKVYPRLLDEASAKLRGLFGRHDYPSQEMVAERFSFGWQLMAIGVPDALAEISHDIWEQEREKSAAQWAQAQEEIQTLLRVRLKSMVEHLVERLSPDKDGKPKIFRNTLVSHMDEFVKDFSALNITDDAELDKVVGQVRDLISGVDAQTLRNSKNVRSTVMEGAAKIEAELNTLIVDKPKRLITFDD